MPAGRNISISKVASTETIVGYTISTSWTEIVSVLATLLMLMFRPAGIFGRRAAF